MKIAMILGKGLDGCGVQRGVVEMGRWAKRRADVKYDVYYVAERGFARGSFHEGHLGYTKMDPSNFAHHAAKIDAEYDIVIFNSYPSAKHSAEVVTGFYSDFVKRIEKPACVGFMHEISKGMIDRIPQLFLILNRMDVVFCFSEKTWFAENFKRFVPSKMGRVKRFKLWASMPELEAIRNAAPRDKVKRITYMGRWTSMKDPRRILDMAADLQVADPEFDALLIGIEKSIGAKLDILDHPRTFYKRKCTIPWDTVPDKTTVLGPYKHDMGMKIMSESMFGASFYRLPKTPNDYGDRFEYTQIETIALGAIPVFDAHFGDNNFTDDGVKFSDVDKLAVWSDRSDLQATIDELVRIASSRTEQDAYREASLQFVKDNFDADVNIPDIIATALALGKQANRPSDDQLLESVFGNKELAAFARDQFLTSGKLRPMPISFKESFDKKVYEFIGDMHKRKELSGAPEPKRPSLKDFFA